MKLFVFNDRRKQRNNIHAIGKINYLDNKLKIINLIFDYYLILILALFDVDFEIVYLSAMCFIDSLFHLHLCI